MNRLTVTSLGRSPIVINSSNRILISSTSHLLPIANRTITCPSTNLQSRSYVHGNLRTPDRKNRFTRSTNQRRSHQPSASASASVPVPVTLDVDKELSHLDLPNDPNGVLKLDANKGAALLLGQEALIVTREIEMMNIFLGFEQANRYALLSPSGDKVGYLMEEEKGLLGGSIQRQLLKTHRPFKAIVLDLEGKPVLRISRGVTLINSRTRVWTIDTNESTSDLKEEGADEETRRGERLVGEVVQSFHVWRRKYELFRSVRDEEEMEFMEDEELKGEKSRELATASKPKERLSQFAKVDSGLLSWDFLLQDENGGLLGAINRNFRGFGRELFTDTGQYVLRFRDLEPQELHTPSRVIETSSGNVIAANPQSSGSRGEVILKQDSRPMTLDERAISLAAAVSIDFDYFSRHSSAGGGGFMPFFWMGGSSPPPPEGDTAESPTPVGQDSSGIQSTPELPGSDSGIGSAAGTAAGYGMMGGGSQGSDSYPDSGFSSPPPSTPPPEAGTQNDGWGFGSREEQGMGQDEEVWGGNSDPWNEAQPSGEEGGGFFSGLNDLLGSFGDD